MSSSSNNFKAVYLPISKSEKQFQVNHVYCVGRNYTEHAIEMGEDERQPPFFFLKPNWAVTSNDVPYPLKTKKSSARGGVSFSTGRKCQYIWIRSWG